MTNVSVVDHGKPLKITPPLEIPTLAEIIWAPDSAKFAVTASDGGSVGTWAVRAFGIQKGSLEEVNITAAAERDFQSSFTCHGEREIPNFAALTWEAKSTRLVVIGEVPPHSSCEQMGRLTAYVVSFPSGAIVAKYVEKDLRQRWGRLLGGRWSQ
jgi:hypothetical protein